jgi:hypothetical protein
MTRRRMLVVLVAALSLTIYGLSTAATPDKPDKAAAKAKATRHDCGCCCEDPSCPPGCCKECPPDCITACRGKSAKSTVSLVALMKAGTAKTKPVATVKKCGKLCGTFACLGPVSFVCPPCDFCD